MDQNIPVVRLDEVYHIGTLSASDLGRNSGSTSQEGFCLSVSLCPHAWQRIAKLGGYPLHELSRDGAAFLDVHAFSGSAGFKAAVKWAQQEGLVEEKTVWRGWEYDDEAEAWRYSLFPTEAAAREEIAFSLMLDDDEDLDFAGPEGESAIESVTSLVATDALKTRCGIRYGDAEDATDGLLIAWVASQTDLDGLWWNETYDPELYSAPRGAIIPGKVAAWSARHVDFDMVDDVESLDDREHSDRRTPGK